MRTVNSMLQAQLKLDVMFELENAMIETETNYVSLQKDQMLHGLNAAGELIGKYKNNAYAGKKNQMNPQAGFGNVDLKLTGNFQADIFSDPRAEGIIVDSADPKSGMLQERYGEIVFGLGDERRQLYVYDLSPVLIESVTEKLNAR